MIKSSVQSTPKVRDYLGFDKRPSEAAVELHKKWEYLQYNVETSLKKIQRKLGFHLDFFEYALAKKGTNVTTNSSRLQHQNSSVQSAIEKYQILRDTLSQINDKMQQINQRQIQGGVEQSEILYQALYYRYLQSSSLQDLSEYDLRSEMDSYLDQIDYENIIQEYVRSRKSNTKIQVHGETFNVFQLKSLIMDSKIDRIRNRFDEEANQVEYLKSMIDFNVSTLQEEISFLKDASVNNSLIESRIEIKDNSTIESKKEEKYDLTQNIQQVKQQQDEMSSKFDQVINQLQEFKRSSEQEQVIKRQAFEDIQKRQAAILEQLKDFNNKYEVAKQENTQLKKEFEQKQAESQQMAGEAEAKLTQSKSVVDEKSKSLDTEKDRCIKLQEQFSRLSNLVPEAEQKSKELSQRVQELKDQNDNYTQTLNLQ